MANRIDAIFERARAQRRRLIMPFVCAGSPRPGTLAAVLRGLEKGGAAIAEVGIPFSDPIADGPVIAAAMHEALGAGSTPARVFEEVRAFREAHASAFAGVTDPIAREMLGADRPVLGLVAMVSMSIVHRCGGPARFAADAADAGFDGLIVPDAPLEESGTLGDAARAAGLTLSLLIAPTTPGPRVEKIAAASSGFIYLMARTGITGETGAAPEIGPRVAALRKCTALPIACGFGVGTPDHVRAVVEHADAAIVGSAMVRRLREGAARGLDPGVEAETFTKQLAQGLPAPGVRDQR